MQSYLIFTWEFANSGELSWNSLIKSSVDMMHLGSGVLAVGGFAALAA